ncbi:MAG: radical SAM protein [Acetobacteraceae bacterium]|nr:radical SAM protein [Acetobacteraceae bacterium]
MTTRVCWTPGCAGSGLGGDLVRRLLAGSILRQVLLYIARNPERNLRRLLSLGERLAIVEGHRQVIRSLKEYVEQHPVQFDYTVRLLRECHPNVRKRLLYNFFVNEFLLGIPKQARLGKKLGVNVPALILVDPTSACNLRCNGCWAGAYHRGDSLDFGRLDRLVAEAKELGIHWIVMSGGEPFLYPRLFELARRHPDVAFMLYTNGTLIDEKKADELLAAGNMSPAFSLEGSRDRTDSRRGPGVFDRIMRAMDLLRERGVPFGFSLTLTRHNCREVMSEEFIDFLVKKGCRYGWTFHYIPIGSDVDTDLLVTPQQRAWLARQVPKLRMSYPLLFADFWNDGQLTGGCIAGGRRYFHINARGEIEPCAFVHFSVDSIYDKSLKEALASPLFKAYQCRQPFSSNFLRPCPLIDVPQALRDIVKESGARPTHPGAETVLTGRIAEFLDKRAAEWERLSQEIWAERQQAVEPTPEHARLSAP